MAESSGMTPANEAQQPKFAPNGRSRLSGKDVGSASVPACDDE